MANAKTRAKRRELRHRAALKKNQIEELEEREQDAEESFPIPDEPEPVEKEYDEGMMMHGPMSYEELDAMHQAHEQAERAREETYNLQELVYNIAYSMMPPEEKGKAIVKVGREFGTRLKTAVSEKMEKSVDMDLLETESIIARDQRHLGMAEKLADFITKKKLTASAENALSDDDFALVLEQDGKKIRKYPIHDKAHVRNALARAAQMMKRGGEAASDAKAAMPKIKAAARKMGIGMSKSILIEKDASGQWRAVLFPTNNFKDRDGEILSEAAHLEYVEWINKNMDCAPAFATWHKPGTARKSPADFIAYDSGFLLVSVPLLEKEAERILDMQMRYDIGLSIGGIALARDETDSNVITKYRMFEVSDLPLERAANPFTDVEIISKEADMDDTQMKQYLAGMLGEERAEEILNKMALTQQDLRKAGVQEKEVSSEPAVPAVKAEARTEPVAPEKVDLDDLVERLSKEFGMQQLSQTIAKLQETAEKVPLLEQVIKEMAESKDETIARMIDPPVRNQLSWMSARPTQSDQTLLKEGDEKDEELKKSAPEMGWLSQATHTTPVYQ